MRYDALELIPQRLAIVQVIASNRCRASASSRYGVWRQIQQFVDSHTVHDLEVPLGLPVEPHTHYLDRQDFRASGDDSFLVALILPAVAFCRIATSCHGLGRKVCFDEITQVSPTAGHLKV